MRWREALVARGRLACRESLVTCGHLRCGEVVNFENHKELEDRLLQESPRGFGEEISLVKRLIYLQGPWDAPTGGGGGVIRKRCLLGRRPFEVCFFGVLSDSSSSIKCGALAPNRKTMKKHKGRRCCGSGWILFPGANFPPEGFHKLGAESMNCSLLFFMHFSLQGSKARMSNRPPRLQVAFLVYPKFHVRGAGL